MIKRNLNAFYDAVIKYYNLDRNQYVNVKIDNVIAYASQEKNFGNVVNMVQQGNSYLPFDKCLLYGLFKDNAVGEVMIYFLCTRIKEQGREYITAKDIIEKSGKIVTEFDEGEIGLYHGKHGIQLVDMFIAQEGGQLIYAGGMIETFYNDYKRMNAFPIYDKDAPELTDDEKQSMFVYYYTALEFFNCKNVKIVRQPIPDKLKKAQIKRTGRAQLESSVIKVYPYLYSKDPKKREIAFDNFTTNDKAPYYTRGHFRTYTEEAKLFGKYTGTYFISPHWRNRKDDDNAKPKDYELIAY